MQLFSATFLQNKRFFLCNKICPVNNVLVLLETATRANGVFNTHSRRGGAVLPPACEYASLVKVVQNFQHFQFHTLYATSAYKLIALKRQRFITITLICVPLHCAVKQCSRGFTNVHYTE